MRRGTGQHPLPLSGHENSNKRYEIDTDGAGFSYDPALVKEYYSKVPGAIDVSPAKNATSWLFPCNATLPDLQIRFGKQGENIATIEGAHFNMEPYGERQGDMCNSCFTAMFGRNLGAPFLMSNFVAFSFPVAGRGAPAVGMAPKRRGAQVVDVVDVGRR